LGVLSGVIVKGPQGVGKSHSLVNLVLKLQASGNYLVTFVPDCDWWRNASFLLRMICHSFNTTPEGILAPDVESGFSGKNLEQFNSVVDAIANKLASNGKYWVFVFDQVNKLFSREGKSSIGELLFPYDMISFIRKPGRVISILSASANNEISDNHESFIEYPHPIEMTANELLTVFDNRYTETNVQEFAGGHPYCVWLYLQIGEVAFSKRCTPTFSSLN
jgi:hypothetical protein